MHELSVDVEEDEGDFSVQAAVFSQVDFSPAALALPRDDFGEMVLPIMARAPLPLVPRTS